MIATIVVLLAVFTVAFGKLHTEDKTHQKFLWEQYKNDFHKKYETFEEEIKRFNNFLENLKIADLRNVAEDRIGGSAVHGITKFSDMSQSEFEATLLRADPSQRLGKAEIVDISAAIEPKFVDWTGVLTTPVKDQGYCGSCWAFSATEQIESDSMRLLKTSYLLSAEQITQCDTTSSGCNGGWTENAFIYVENNGGIQTEETYPYTSYSGTLGTCSADQSKNVIKVHKYHSVKGEEQMAAYMQTVGPLSVCIDATNWNSYTGGIVSNCGGSGYTNHCVQAVGVYPASSGGYWKVRNQWSSNWGESGFIRLAYGIDACLISHDPHFLTVSKA